MAIKLRGHHIDLFGKYYIARPDNFEEWMDGAHSGNFLKYLSEICFDAPELVQLYGISFTMGVFLLWEKLIAEPETEIRIVRGLDYICKSGCRMSHEICEVGDAHYDQKFLDNYALDVGETYTIETILERIKAKA